jgi:hypothetical protein
LADGRDRRQDDPVEAQRMKTKSAGAKNVDQFGSHAVYISQPAAVAKVIEVADAEIK